MTILLVDDDEDDRTLFLEATMEVDATIMCVVATSGQEALLYLRNETNPLPEFVFLDLRMPGISGQTCLQEIRKDSRLDSVQVIVYTTSRDVKEARALKRMGAAHFMSKPTSPEEVYYMVSYALGEKWK